MCPNKLTDTVKAGKPQGGLGKSFVWGAGLQLGQFSCSEVGLCEVRDYLLTEQVSAGKQSVWEPQNLNAFLLLVLILGLC